MPIDRHRRDIRELGALGRLTLKVIEIVRRRRLRSRAAWGYNSTGIRNLTFSSVESTASHESRPGESRLGGDLRRGSTTTVRGTLNDVVEELWPTG
jgi:hypothetical protein